MKLSGIVFFFFCNRLVSNGARREVSRDEAKAFAEQNGLFFVETSARTGVNVEEVFNMVTQEVCPNEFISN